MPEASPAYHAPPAARLRFGPAGRFELQADERRLLVDGRPAALGARALDVLIALVARPGQLITKNELLDRVWPDVVVEENNLQVQIRHLRKLLGSEWPRRAKPMRWRAVMPSSSPPASGARTMRVEMSLATQLSMLLVLMVSTKADLPRIAGRQRRTDSCGGSSYHCNRR